MSNNSTFLKFSIEKSENTYIYFRAYSKLGDVLSFVGGLIRAISLIIGVFAFPYNELKRNLAIANEIYEFEMNSKYNPKNRERRKSTRTTTMLSSPYFRGQRQGEIEERKRGGTVCK
jgi:hypothetical protein